MFYMHLFSLPGFAATLPDMLRHAALWSASPATSVVLGEAVARAAASGSGASAAGLLGVRLSAAVAGASPLARLPIMWTYVALNVVTQYVCIQGVYQLTPIVDPLSVNVTLTVRKFVSLLVSIYLFNNTFTAAHWVGACLVFGGALWYGRLQGPPKGAPQAAAAVVAQAAAAGGAAPAVSGALPAGGAASGELRAGVREGRTAGAQAGSGAFDDGGHRNDDDGGGGGGGGGAGGICGGGCSGRGGGGAGDEEGAPPTHVSGVVASGAGGVFTHRPKAR